MNYKYLIMILWPTTITVLAYLFQKKVVEIRSVEGKKRNIIWQCVIGILFGILACLSVKYGIKKSNEIICVCDSLILSCGLVFGGPSGIVAGVIAGVFRWLSVGIGTSVFTQIDSSVACILAGIYAFLTRKYMFENKMPSWAMGFFIGSTLEIIHFSLMFFTEMNYLKETLAVLDAIAKPTIILNGTVVALIILIITLLAGERLFYDKKHGAKITQTVQAWLLGTVMVALVCSSVFSFSLQALIADMDTTTVIENTITDVKKDIRDASDDNLLKLTAKIADEVMAVEEISDELLLELAAEYEVNEINKVNNKGIITNSTTAEYLDYDMNSGEQSAEFMCLVAGTSRQYVQELMPVSYDDMTFMKYAGVRTKDGGFVQVGYTKNRFHDDIKERIALYAVNRHIGSNGYVVITDNRFNYESYGVECDIKYLSNDSGPDIFGKMLTGVDEYSIVKGNILNRDVYCMYTTSEDYYIIGVYPLDEAYFTRNIAMYANGFTEIIIFAILFVLIYVLIRVIVVNNIFKINKSLSDITGGNLDTVVDVRSNEEFSLLSNDINSTVDTLKRYIAEAASRIDAELQYARDIQASALPHIEPNFVGRKNYELHACMYTAKEVGGDFYDFYYVDDKHLAITVADVSGKGIPAALFMMTSKTMLRNMIESGMSVEEAMTLANERLCDGNEANMFVTVWAGVIDLETGHMEYGNAGHNFPAIRKADGTFEFLKCRPSMVMAGMEGIKYRKNEYDLEDGDTLYLYTDGVVEATNNSDELFGDDRLIASLNKSCSTDMTVEELCLSVKEDVDEFVDEAPQFDDITMLAIKYQK